MAPESLSNKKEERVLAAVDEVKREMKLDAAAKLHNVSRNIVRDCREWETAIHKGPRYNTDTRRGRVFGELAKGLCEERFAFREQNSIFSWV